VSLQSSVDGAEFVGPGTDIAPNLIVASSYYLLSS
jgi:hypothetical protein